MSEVLTSVFASVGVSGALTAGLVWFSKTWMAEKIKREIEYEYHEKLESHKAKLNADNHAAIEILRAQLRTDTAMREMRFGKIYERMADNIWRIHAGLKRFHQCVNALVIGVQLKGEQQPLDLANKAVEELSETFTPIELFLPESTAKKISDCVSELSKLVFRHRRRDKRIEIDADYESDLKRVNETIPSLLKALEKDFRNLLRAKEFESGEK